MRQTFLSQGETLIFEDPWKIDHIGIHAAPNSKFQINGDGEFYVGGTGIFEINLEGKNSYIKSIKCLDSQKHFVLIDYSGKGVTL